MLKTIKRFHSPTLTAGIIVRTLKLCKFRSVLTMLMFKIIKGEFPKMLCRFLTIQGHLQTYAAGFLLSPFCCIQNYEMTGSALCHEFAILHLL